MLVPKIDLRLKSEKIKVNADAKMQKKAMVVLILKFKVNGFASNERLRKPPAELRLMVALLGDLRLMVVHLARN